MEKILKLYTYIDGVNDTPFPNEAQQVITSDFRSDYKRMGSVPTISCTIMHPLCLDKLWTYSVYATFNGEKFFIKHIPTSSYDNTDSRYKHELELVSERRVLENVYVYDVVSSDTTNDKPVSNSSKFVFFGTINEYAERLNRSLEYSGLDYRVVVDDGISSESKLVSFENQFFSNAIQESYNIYEIPYYYVGKEIHIGYTNNRIDHTFKYGQNESLLSIEKQNTNNRIINRITGVGSSDNIPFYYPNNSEVGELDYTILDTNGNNITNQAFVKNFNNLAKSVQVGTTYTCIDTTNYIYLNVLGSYARVTGSSSSNSQWVSAKYGDQHLGFETRVNFSSFGGVVETNTSVDYRLDFELTEDAQVTLSFFAAASSGLTPFYLSDFQRLRVYEYQEQWLGNPIPYYETTNLLGEEITLSLKKGKHSIVLWQLDVYKVYLSAGITSFTVVLNKFNAKTAPYTKKGYIWRNDKGDEFKDLNDIGVSGIEDSFDNVGMKLSTRVLYRIMPQTNLMPEIYRSTKGEERFYNALNDTYSDENGNYYGFENQYFKGNPKEHIQDFDDIKPTIKGMLNALGEPIDVFQEFAYDKDDNDEFDEEGNYLHPYFFGKLRKFDGEFGFNLFDHAIEEDEMVISMTTGSCGACEFIIGVDSDTQKNLVQVDENGNLLRDANGNVRCGREGMPAERPQERQNDTKNNEVWIALKKDINTFGVVMPNATNNYKPSVKDTFVILHIELPKSYVLAAEERLKDALIKYMHDNNSEKFTFSISFSRIFFAENQNILDTLNENSLIRVEYDGELYDLYVSSYSYSMSSDKLLPEIKVEISDDIKIEKNALQKSINELEATVSNTQQKNIIEVRNYITKTYIPSNTDSTNKGVANYENGLKIGGNAVTRVVTTDTHEPSSDEKVYTSKAVDEKIKNALENANVSGDFLSKTKEDVAQKKIVFKEGVGIGDAVILWDEEQGGLHIQKFDGTPAGLWTDSYLSAKGANPNGGGSSEDGATTLGGLRNVAADADSTYDVAKMLVLEAKSNLWTLKNLSDLVGGLDEAELAEYLTNNEYAKKSDIPSLEGYATNEGVSAELAKYLPLKGGTLTGHLSLKPTAYIKIQGGYSILGLSDNIYFVGATNHPTNIKSDGTLTHNGAIIWDSETLTNVSQLTNDANYATTSDLDARIDALVNGAPQAYDTLKEIADVLANNINSIDDILTALGTKVSKDDFNTAIANVNTAIDSLNTELGLKLDAVTFNELFEKVQLEDGTWAIKAKLGLFSDGFISAKGSNVGGTSSEGGAVALYQLNDVLADGTGVSGAQHGAVFVYDATIGKWKGVAQSEIVPNLTGYATESWVLSQGFLTQHQDLSDYAKLSDIPVIPTTDINKGVTAHGWGDHSKVGYLTGITSALVTGALGYTPYNVANFTKANIKSTLGISDWALASSKPSYTTKEVSEDTNLYFTNARAVAALKSITDELSSSITSNTTKITNLTTKVDDHIAVFNSMFKLVELSDGTMSIQALHGLWSDGFISAKGANSSGGSSSGGGLITSLYRYADLGKTFADTNNDTFNAYTINKINTDLGNRISVLEGKATNVSFTQSLTSGTQIGSISIDGVAKNIYAPTIPTDDINKGVTAYGWGNHASAGYAMASALGGYLPLTGGTIKGNTTYQDTLQINNNAGFSVIRYNSHTEKLGYIGFQEKDKPSFLNASVSAWYSLYHSGNTSTIKSDLGLGTFAYKSSLAFADLTNKPTTIGGYGITDAYTKSQVNNALSGYLPLSGGTITGNLIVQTHTVTCELYPSADDTYSLGQGTRRWRNLHTNLINGYTPIHSGNIGSQSVASAAKLTTARSIWGQSFDGTGNVGGNLHLDNSKIYWHSDSANYYIDNYYDGTNSPLMRYMGYSGHRFMTSSGEVMRINSSGNVGIGTTNPQYKLDVNGTMYGDLKMKTPRTIWGQSFNGTGDVTGTLHITTHSINTDYSEGIRINALNGGYSSIWLNTVNAYGYDVGMWGITAMSGGNLRFRGGSTSLNDLMVITKSGNVGIGTTSPSFKLNVVNNSGWTSYFLSENSNVAAAHNDGYGLSVNSKTTSSSHYLLSVKYGQTSLGSGGSTAIYARGDGNVGIGTENPQYKLDVSGTLHASGAVSFGSTLDVTGAITKPTTSASNMTSNYISAGGGYSSGTGKYGVKILCCDQDNAQTGLGQDLGGLTGGYELSVVGGTSSAGQGYISFVTHGVNSTSYRKLGYFYDNKGVISFDVLGTIHSTTGIWSDGYVSAKGQNTSSDMRLKNVLNDVVLGVKDIANAPSMRFSWKNGGGVDVGSSAQYWQGLLPDAVKERDGMLEMQYANIALLSAIALAKNFETMDERVARLERENEELRTKIDMMERGIA